MEEKRYFEDEKPAWLFVDAKDGLDYSEFNYFPDGHYSLAIEQALKEEEELVADGGRYTDTCFAWYDPETDTLLHHTEVEDEFSDPFFDSREEAHRFLENRAEDDEHRYEGLTLQKYKSKKVGEAVEVLTDQSGLNDFVPDGGTTDEVYFWHDPLTNQVMQEEVEPGIYAGLFDQKEEAIRFYRENTPDTEERLDLYRARIEEAEVDC